MLWIISQSTTRDLGTKYWLDIDSYLLKVEIKDYFWGLDFLVRVGVQVIIQAKAK